jgi:hypothetical protein
MSRFGILWLITSCHESRLAQRPSGEANSRAMRQPRGPDMDRGEVRKRHELGNGSRPMFDRAPPAKRSDDRLLNHLALASVMLFLELELRAFVRACNAA